MFTKEFWRAVAERAIKTLFQALGAALVAAGTGIVNTDWVGIFSIAGMAAVISVCTSVGTGALTDGSPSASTAEVLTTTAPQKYEIYPELDPQLESSEEPTDADLPETDVAEEGDK